jgi:hypothetical protein
MASSETQPRRPVLEFNRIEPLHDPALLRLEPEEIAGAQKRLRRDATELVDRWMQVSVAPLLERATVEVPQFRYLGGHHNVLACSLIHIQEDGCGMAPPTSIACADARSIVDLVTAALQLSMGGVSEVTMEAIELLPRIETFGALVADRFYAENQNRSFPGSRSVCEYGERLHNGIAELDALLREARRDLLVAAPDALDTENRPALSRAEGAFWALGLEPSAIRQRIVDQRGSPKRPENNIRGRYKPERPWLEIKVRT